mgnify:CR=1 FL=1
MGMRKLWEEVGAPVAVIAMGLLLLAGPVSVWVDDAVIWAEMRFVHPQPTIVMEGDIDPGGEVSCPVTLDKRETRCAMP